MKADTSRSPLKPCTSSSDRNWIATEHHSQHSTPETVGTVQHRGALSSIEAAGRRITTGSDPAWTCAAAAVALAIFTWRLYVPIQDPDGHWLRWAGGEILAGRYPRTNALSWTAPDAAWALHETVPAVALALTPTELTPHLRGLILFAVVGAALALARSRNAIATTLALCAWGPAAYFALSERAAAWGLLALALEVLLVRRRQYSAAALVVMAWASVHGSFVAGIGYLALFSPGWALAAAIGATLNPQGPGIYALVWSYARPSGAMALAGRGIVEWAPFDLGSPLQVLAVGSVLVLGCVALSGPRDWRTVILVAASVALVHRSFRHAPIAATWLLPIAANALADWKWLPERRLGDARSLYKLGASMAMMLVGMVPFQPVDAPAIPAGLRIWNDHELGGALGAAGVPVFWDGRNDCYPPTVFADGLEIEQNGSRALEVLDAWDVEAVVTSRPDLIARLTAAGWSTP